MTTPEHDTRYDRDKSATGAELEAKFPEVEDGLIRDLVSDAYDRLTPAKVDIYLPILVAHEVTDALRDLDADTQPDRQEPAGR